jgi:hypothetical protein
VVAGSFMTAGGVFCGGRQSYDCTRCFKITTILPLILLTCNNFYFLYITFNNYYLLLVIC